jgi:hypothetical protein
VKEIEEIRGRLEDDLAELQDRIPRQEIKRVMIGTGAALAGLGAVSVISRWRAARRVPKVELVVPAVVEEAIASFRASAPEVRVAAAGMAGVWFLLRVTEIYQLRRLRGAIRKGLAATAEAGRPPTTVRPLVVPGEGGRGRP